MEKFVRHSDLSSEEKLTGEAAFPLSFSNEISAFLRETYSSANQILEYGSGGSTLVAAQLGKRFVSVESDEEWANSLRKVLSRIDTLPSDAKVVWADIGATKEWGYPIDNRKFQQFWSYPLAPWQGSHDCDPDVVLVDGRFRKACFCTAIAMSRKPMTILFDDYRDRKFYHEVEKLVRPAKFVDRMAVFEVSPSMVTAKDLPLFAPWFVDLR